MRTQQDMLAEILSCLKPAEKENQADYSKQFEEISDKFDMLFEKSAHAFKEVKDKISPILNNLSSSRHQENDAEDDIETEKDKLFAKRRWYFVFSGTVVLSIALVTAFYQFLGLFGLIFGFLLAFMTLGLLLAFDEYVLPGNTIKRISKNGIASSIAFLGFIIIIIGGTSIGNSLITNRDRGEEVTTPTSQRVFIEEPKQLRQYDSTASNKEQ